MSIILVLDKPERERESESVNNDVNGLIEQWLSRNTKKKKKKASSPPPDQVHFVLYSHVRNTQ